MSVSASLQKYLESRFTGLPSDDDRKTLAGECEELFEAVRKDRQLFDARWYQNQRFMDGDHYLTWEHSTGKVTNDNLVEENKSKRLKRSINVMKAQIRGLKNFVLKIPLTVEVAPAPADDSDQAKQASEAEAKQKNAVVRAIEHKLKLRELRRPIVDDGFIKNAAYIFVLPTADGMPDVKQYDGYDVFPDPTAPAFYDGFILFLATRQNVQAIKANKSYENTGDLKGDGRLAASTFKNSYEQSRSGAARQVMQGDLETVIWKQAFVKFPFTIAKQADLATGQETQSLQPTQDGKPRIWIVTFSASEIHRIEETDFTRWPGIRYTPEQSGNRIHANGWATDLQDPNRTVDNMMSKAEEWHIKGSPKLMVPSDSKLKEVTNITGEVLEYDQRKADGIKDYMPSGVPASIFTLIDRAQGFAADVGGIHPASAGSVPVGVKSGKALESLQAADAEFNMAEPMDNFALFWQEMWERILEAVSDNVTEPVTLDYPEAGTVRKVTFVGKAGATLKDGNPAPLPQGTVVIDSGNHVTVRAVPEVSYTEDGKKETLLELYNAKAIDLQTLLEGYRFGNVGEIVERVMAEKAQAAQTPPPPPLVPADRMVTALANLQKSGTPLTLDVVNAELQKAGLPPIQMATPPAMPPQPVAPIDASGGPAILQ